jgi:hypothetical protein
MENTPRAQRLEEARELLQGARRRGPRYRYQRRREGETHDPTPQVEVAAPGISARISAALRKWKFKKANRRQTENQTTVVPFSWAPYLRVILCGTRNEQSSLSILRGYENTIVKHIYSYLLDLGKPLVTLTTPAHVAGRFYDRNREQVDMEVDGDEYEFVVTMSNPPRATPAVNVLIHDRGSNCTLLGPKKEHRPQIAFTICGRVDFPPPQGIEVNMLPFIMGDPESLPNELQPYYDTVIARCPVEESEIGKVVYLTVNEGFVKAGNTQRRGGLHIEAPGSFKTEASFTAAVEHHWGQGMADSPDELHGGLFVASNVNGTSKVWDAIVKQTGAVDSHGGMEHLRSSLGDGYELAANELVWLTDRTPHEALPQQEDGYRQFFRLVTSEISVWFAEHSTPNPKVPLPDFVRVMYGSKFA